MSSLKERLGYAIIGCGVIAPSHAEAIAKLEQGYLYAVCDIVAEKADGLAKRYGANKVYFDYMELLRDSEVDVVCVCTPSGMHGEMCIAAAAAGKHIICEKPMEITNEKIEEVIAAVDKHGVKMQCIFQRRTMSTAIAARKAVREGKLGRILLASAYLKYYRDQKYYDSAGWRGTYELDGGGALMNQGVHGVDLLQWIVGERVVSVVGKAKALARNMEVEDTAVAILQFENGGFGVIEGATIAYPGLETKFEIHGEYGTIIFSDSGVKTWEFLNTQVDRPDDGESIGGSKSNTGISGYSHHLLIKDMNDAIIEDREPMIPPSEGKTAVAIITAIYLSQQENREISIYPY